MILQEESQKERYLQESARKIGQSFSEKGVLTEENSGIIMEY